jgi:hypothetical protein
MHFILTLGAVTVRLAISVVGLSLDFSGLFFALG